MKLLNIKGKPQSKNVSKYLIKWDKKSRSGIQFNVKKYLKTIWKNDSVYEEFPVFGSLLKVDFLNSTKKIAIEVNGPQHSSYNPFFHNNSISNFLKSIKRDCSKSEWLKLNGYKLIEIDENNINKINTLLI